MFLISRTSRYVFTSLKNLSAKRFSTDLYMFNEPTGEPPKNFKEAIKRIIDAHKYVRSYFKGVYEEIFLSIHESLGKRAIMLHLEYAYFVKFRDLDEEKFKKWKVSTDAITGGYSTATLQKHPQRGTAIFSGNLNVKVPKSGEIVRSGLVNVRSPLRFTIRGTKSIDLAVFNNFLIRYRGDGRSYSFLLHLNEKNDIQQLEIATFPLYTHGGPLWQEEKIPFHKYFKSLMGRIIDRQSSIMYTKINSISFSLMDATTGPFCLEIDYIALLFEQESNKTFSYEYYTASSRSQRFK